MWKRLQSLIFIGLMVQGCDAAASAATATASLADAVAMPAPVDDRLTQKTSRRSTRWRSSSSSAIAAALLNDLAKRRRNGRQRNINVRNPASLARILKRLP